MSLKILLQTILRLAREQAQHKILEKKERKRERDKFQYSGE